MRAVVGQSSCQYRRLCDKHLAAFWDASLEIQSRQPRPVTESVYKQCRSFGWLDCSVSGRSTLNGRTAAWPRRWKPCSGHSRAPAIDPFETYENAVRQLVNSRGSSPNTARHPDHLKGHTQRLDGWSVRKSSPVEICHSESEWRETVLLRALDR